MQSYPPVGKLVDVGGHRLHVHTTGRGSPTVVLEAGGGSWSLDWSLVQPEVARFTRVCSYDRAGFGWSDPGPQPRTSQQIIKELHALLVNARLSGPYVFVGHSFGGYTARLYASQYPGEVMGMVLIDARHQALVSRLPPAWRRQETIAAGMYRFLSTMARLKLLGLLGALMGEKAAPPVVKKLPPEIRPMYLAVGFQPKYFDANLDELAASAESDKQLSATGSLGNMPLTVIRHGMPDLFASMPADQARQAEQIWQELQADLAGLSSNSKLVVAEKGGHGIPVDQPALVVDAIRQVVEIVRRASP